MMSLNSLSASKTIDLFRLGPPLHRHDLAIALFAGLAILAVLEGAKRPFWQMFGGSGLAKPT
jgi:hypothetical protein